MATTVPSARSGWHRSALVPAALVLVLGLGASWAAAAAALGTEDRNAEQAFDQRAELAQVAVSAEVRRYLGVLGTVAAGVGAQQELTRASFLAATAPLTTAQLPGATGVSFVVAAGAGQVGAVERRWRQRGATGLRLRPTGSGPEHLFAVFRRSLDGGPSTVTGADAGAVPEAVVAIGAARASGATAISPPYVLQRDRGLPAAQRRLSFVLAAPVYADAAGTGRGPREPQGGWVTLSMHGQDFFGTTLRSVTQGVLDASLQASDYQGHLVRVAAISAGHRPSLRRRATVTVAQRQWVLETAADPAALPGGRTPLPPLLGAGGSLFTALLAGLVYLLSLRWTHARRETAAAVIGLSDGEREVARQESLLSGVLNRVSDGVVVVDESGTFLLRNPAADRILGVAVGDAGSPDSWQRHFGVFRPDGGTPFPTEELPLVRAIAGESPEDVEMVIRNPAQPDGLIILVSASPLAESAGQRGAVAIFRDITAVRQASVTAIRDVTERRRQQVELADLNTALVSLNGELEGRVAERTGQLEEQANTLRAANAELESFSYSVSHDLRAPLRTVDGFAKLIEQGHSGGLDDAGRRYLGKVRQGATQMGDLIDGLLAFSRLQRQTLTVRPVNLAELVAETWAELADDRAGRSVELTVGALPPAVADPRLLRHVIANVIGNAVKYTRCRDAAHIEIGARTSESGQVSYYVRDNGTGFDMEYAGKLFEVFQRLHRAEDYEGTGIGLALAARIIHRHGGRIWAEAEPDRGATFWFTLTSEEHSHAHPDIDSAFDRGQPERPGADPART